MRVRLSGPCRGPTAVLSPLAGASLGGAAVVLLAIQAGACAPASQQAGGRDWSIPEYELSLRFPDGWRVQDAYALYARQRGVPESEARRLPLAEVVRGTRLLMVAHPPPASGASAVCSVTIAAEDVSGYPGVETVEAYAQLAERAGTRRLQRYERLAPDIRLRAGQAPAVRRECRAQQMVSGQPRLVRNLTLFLMRGGTGLALGAYELEDQFDARRSEFEAILASVRAGPAPAQSGWRRLLGRLRGATGRAPGSPDPAAK